MTQTMRDMGQKKDSLENRQGCDGLPGPFLGCGNDLSLSQEEGYDESKNPPRDTGDKAGLENRRIGGGCHSPEPKPPQFSRDSLEIQVAEEGQQAHSGGQAPLWQAREEAQ